MVKPSIYYIISAIAAALVGIGLIMSTSASGVLAYLEHEDSFHFFWRQIGFTAVGFVVLIIASKLNRRTLRMLSPLGLGASVALLVAVYVLGEESGGAVRWLDIAGLRFQPSEVAKLAAIFFTADILSRKRSEPDTLRGLAVPLGLPLIVVAALVFGQPDLGTTVIIVFAVFLMFYLAEIRLSELGLMASFGLAAGVAAVAVAPYRMARIIAFLDPWADPQGAGYQLVQAQMAFGSGGWTGVGLGMSRQKFGYLPEPYTDFIFAVIGEEMGLLGTVVVAALYFMLALAVIHVVRISDDLFSKLLAAGIGVMIVGQAFINIGGVTGIMPLTGVTLPLISVGGTSLLVTMAGIGVLLNLAQTNNGGKRGASGDGSNLRRRDSGARVSRSRPGRSA